MEKLKYTPDYVVAPGASLKELLEERGISQSELAVRAEMSAKTINQIVNGVAPITYDTAEKFELVLGVPANYWNRKELAYREYLARVEATEKLETEIAWLKEIPVKELKERNLVERDADKASLVRQVLKFFGVSSVEAWRTAWEQPSAQYRGKKTQEKHPGYVAAWLRIGELQAESIESEPFSADEFRRALGDVREMTCLPPNQWEEQVGARCAEAGVAVVFTKEIAGAAISGATRWLTKDKALIQLSLKFKSDDQVWFSFFHEAGHILLHGKKQVFIENGLGNTTEEEREANEFARDLLIPPAFAGRLPNLKIKDQVKAFAILLRIAPSIVVGRMQYDGLIHRGVFNDLKIKLEWAQ